MTKPRHPALIEDVEREQIVSITIEIPCYGTNKHVEKSVAAVTRILETGLHSAVEVAEWRARNAKPPKKVRVTA